MSGYILNYITVIIVIIGALNWGIIGVSGTNIVERIFGVSVSKIIYIIVGFAGLIQLILLVTAKNEFKYLL